MKKIKIVLLIVLILAVSSCFNSNNKEKTSNIWKVDFFDDFDNFNSENWQDQRIWVNNEKQCYVPDGNFGTRKVEDGLLKLKVINIGEEYYCDNLDKFGNKHPNTNYVAGRIASKNRK